MNVSDILSPVPKRPPKRSLEDLDSELEPALKRHRPVISWLINLPPSPSPSRTESAPPPLDRSKASPLPPLPSNRPKSLPLKLDSIKIPRTTHCVDEKPQSPVSIGTMSPDQQKESTDRGSSKSSITRIKSSDPKYQSVLKYNSVHMDKTGLDMSDDIKVMIKGEILKKRGSPPLSKDVLNDTAKTMAEWANTTENVLSGLTNSPLFPIQLQSLGKGGNSRWPTTALPYNPDYKNPLSPPNPDFHVGYPIGLNAPWSAKEACVVDHPYAQPYTQPATANSFPFFTLELKSEATGGTLWHAENQAAGSGTYCVKAMQWLMQHAEPASISSPVDTVSFSVAANARHVIFYVHYYSPETETYVMSYMQCCTITDPEDIQQCRNIVKNITEYGLGVRLKTLQKCLQKIYPQTNLWLNKRPASATELPEPSTPATSFTPVSSTGGRKSQKRGWWPNIIALAFDSASGPTTAHEIGKLIAASSFHTAFADEETLNYRGRSEPSAPKNINFAVDSFEFRWRHCRCWQ